MIKTLGSDTIEKISKNSDIIKSKITIPNCENIIVKGCDLKIVDLPGLDNAYWRYYSENYLEKYS